MDEMITTVDCSTGEAVERPFTPEEQAQRDADLAAAAEAAAKHQPFGLAGRIATLLAVHVIKSEVTGEPIPLQEWANVVGSEPAEVQQEFLDWIEAGA